MTDKYRFLDADWETHAVKTSRAFWKEIALRRDQ